jgi:predicted nucleic acid-binding protein
MRPPSINRRSLWGEGRQYVTTDYVVSELITQLYRLRDSDNAESYVTTVMGASESGAYRLERVTPQRFSKAWQLRWRYADQAAISFVDFTSFVVMNELGIRDVFTGDSHFEQINMGFQLFPRSL